MVEGALLHSERVSGLKSGGEIKEDEEMNEGDDESFTPCEGFQIGP